MPDVPLPDNQGFLLETYGRSAFSRDVIAEFPDLANELEEYSFSIDIQVGILAESVRKALKDGRLEFISRILSFLQKSVNHPRARKELFDGIKDSFVKAEELRSNTEVWLQCQSIAPGIRQMLLDVEKAEANPK